MCVHTTSPNPVPLPSPPLILRAPRAPPDLSCMLLSPLYILLRVFRGARPMKTPADVLDGLCSIPGSPQCVPLHCQSGQERERMRSTRGTCRRGHAGHAGARRCTCRQISSTQRLRAVPRAPSLSLPLSLLHSSSPPLLLLSPPLSPLSLPLSLVFPLLLRPVFSFSFEPSPHTGTPLLPLRSCSLRPRAPIGAHPTRSPPLSLSLLSLC